MKIFTFIHRKHDRLLSSSMSFSVNIYGSSHAVNKAAFEIERCIAKFTPPRDLVRVSKSDGIGGSVTTRNNSE